MKAPAECETWTYRWIVKWSGPQPLAAIWVWSWDPLRFVRRHPPHRLSPARAKSAGGASPEVSLSRPKSPQQCSDRARKPVNSEPDSCSLVRLSADLPKNQGAVCRLSLWKRGILASVDGLRDDRPR